MREIVFRGKEIDTGNWVYGWYERYPFGRWPLRDAIIPYEDAEAGEHRTEEVDPATVGQYTGLKDKNGRMIFEGDIVEHCYQKGFFNRGLVIWDSQNARFAHELRSMSPAFFMHNPEAWEAIGNIFDNPELLEEANSHDAHDH